MLRGMLLMQWRIESFQNSDRRNGKLKNEYYWKIEHEFVSDKWEDDGMEGVRVKHVSRMQNTECVICAQSSPVCN